MRNKIIYFLVICLLVFGLIEWKKGTAHTFKKSNTNANAMLVKKTKELARQGNAKAENNLGYDYDLGLYGVPQNYSKAVYWWKKSANQGNADAFYALGDDYYRGQGVPQNYSKAVYCFKKAIILNDEFPEFPEYGLGNAYKNGYGVPQDYTKAFYWYRKSAHQGYDDAFYALGLAYYKGQGVKKNYKKAVFWLKYATTGPTEIANKAKKVLAALQQKS